MWARWVAGLVWAVVAATVVMWALRLAVRPGTVPAHAVPVGSERAAKGDVSRLFAAPAVPVARAAPEAPANNGSNRLRLVGLVAPYREGAKAHAVALIALDGKPPRAYRVGAAIDDQWVLQSVSRRSASVGPLGGAPTVVLEMPALPPPATGTLARPAGDGGPAGGLSAVPLQPPRGGATAPAFQPALPAALPPQPPGLAQNPAMPSPPMPNALSPRPVDVNVMPSPERPAGAMDPNTAR